MYLNETHQQERQFFNALDPEDRQIMLAYYAEKGLYNWHLIARDKQLCISPTGKTLLNAARGFGKTRSLLEYIIYCIVYRGAKTVVLVGETTAKISDLLLEGSEGLLQKMRDYGIQYIKSRNRITIPKYNCTILGYSGDIPDRLRGFNADLVVIDELCAMYYAEETLLQAELICRKGNSKLLIATTPKPFRWYKKLVNSAEIQIITGTTAENTALPKDYTESLKRRYGENSNILLQELEAKIVDDVEGALWSYASIAAITRPLPHQAPDMVVVSIDPSTGVFGGDEFGIIVLHKYGSHVYCVEDLTGMYTPEGAARKISETPCDYVVMEGSGQQLFFKTILQKVNPKLKIQVVHPRVSKLTRAETVKIAGDNGTFSLMQGVNFARLCEEMTTYNGTGDSPNRLDALSQGVRWLSDGTIRSNLTFDSARFRRGHNGSGNYNLRKRVLVGNVI